MKARIDIDGILHINCESQAEDAALVIWVTNLKKGKVDHIKLGLSSNESLFYKEMASLGLKETPE